MSDLSVTTNTVIPAEDSIVAETAQTESTIQDLKRKSVSGAVSYFIRTLFLHSLGIGASLILAAKLSPAEYGIYGFVLQIIGILTFFSDVGLAAALVQQRESPSEREYRTAFTVQFLLSVLLVIICLAIIATGLVSAKTGSAGVWILLTLALSFPLGTLRTIPSIQLERKLEFSKLVIPQIAEQLVFYTVLIGFVLQEFGVMSYAPAIILRSLSGVIVTALLQPWKWRFGIERSSLRQLISFGIRFQGNDLLARIKDQLFYLTLAIFFPLREFGFIQWSKNWSLYPYNLTVQNVMAITFPTFSRLQHDLKLLARAIEKSLFFICLAIFPILVLMCTFIYPFISLVPVYEKWLPAVPSLIFFTLSIAGSAISSPLTNTLNAIGKINDTLKLMSMWTVLTWALTPVFVWVFGFNGVSFAALVIGITSLVPVVLVRKYVPFKLLEQLLAPTVGAVCMAVIAWLGSSLWSSSYVWFVAGMVLSGAVYLLGVCVAGGSKLVRELQSLRARA